MANAELIKRLRATTHEADPYALMAEAADALEASDDGAAILDEAGMDANDKLSVLAGLVLRCDMATPQGLRAKDYARYCLGQIKDNPEAL